MAAKMLTVAWRDVAPVMEGSINDTSEEPLCPCRRVRQNCPCHGCSPAKKSNLNFMFPSALKRFRRHLLASPARSNVCCALQCSSDGCVVAPPLSKQGIDSGCPGCAGLGFLSCSWTVCDQMTPALRLLEPLLHWGRPHTHPGRRCVLGQQR